MATLILLYFLPTFKKQVLNNVEHYYEGKIYLQILCFQFTPAKHANQSQICV